MSFHDRNEPPSSGWLPKSRLARRSVEFLAAELVAATLVCGCKDEPPAPRALVFETDVRAAYTEVRPCRLPGEHSGLGAFTVWASNDAIAAFAAIWQDPPALARLPAEAVVVKEVYTGTDCAPEQVLRWVAMRKEPGFDPAHGDWHWQSVEASGDVVVDGIDDGCITCHRGNDTCTGYGEAAGRDYLCTVP